MSEKRASPVGLDGWTLSDFCAMNYLLKGLGSRQEWFSTISEARLIHLIKTDVEFQPGLLHGNPCKDRKIVFNADLVDRGELTPWTVVKSATIISALLS